jgi:sterol desaturase/sphingolipid hydroxylase (fatty acid hydroxylase superfamily)
MQLALSGALRYKYADPFIASVSFIWWIGFYTAQESLSRQPALSPLSVVSRTIRIVFSLSNWIHLLSYYAGVFMFMLVLPPPRELNMSIVLDNPQSEAIRLDGIPITGGGFMYLLLEVVSGIVLYDFLFFFLHMLLHTPGAWRLHKTHHTHYIVTAKSVLNHSVIDAILQVVTNIVVQRYNYVTMIIPGYYCTTVKTRLARALHNIIIVAMLTESHANVNTRDHFVLFRRVPSLFPGISRHREHHVQHTKYRQAFFGYLDHWMSTD